MRHIAITDEATIKAKNSLRLRASAPLQPFIRCNLRRGWCCGGRSLDQRALGSLLEGLHSLGVVIVPLQFGEEQAQVDPWRRLLSQGLAADADFATTAALVADLDLVLSVDTSMAHLVGAMRRRGWLLLPHAAAPRWLRTRPDSPWYPSLRLFRQPRTGDWQGVVDAVIAALASELEGRMC